MMKKVGKKRLVGIFLTLFFFFAVSAFAAVDSFDFVSPTDPNGGMIADRNWAYINLSVTNSTPIDSFIINWNGENITIGDEGVGEYFANITDIADGTYTFLAYINDTEGNSLSTEKRTITFSTSPQMPLESSIELVSPENSAVNLPKDVTLKANITGTGNVSFYGREKLDKFSIIVLPDTENYASNSTHSWIFLNQTKWIVEMKDDLNIKFVIHLGDVVKTWNSTEEWDIANLSMSLLDEAGIPYSMAPGENDHENGSTDGSTEFFNEYFGVDRFSSNAWWGGNYNNNDNSYQLLTINGNDYIFLSLDWCPSQDEIGWANETLINHSERKAVLTTHGYMNNTGELNISSCGDTTRLWNDLIRYHPNLQIVLSGHENGEANRTDSNLGGNPVYQMLSNYEDRSYGGKGWLRILEFVPAENKVNVKTFSKNIYENDSNSSFSFEYESNATSFQKIAELKNVTGIVEINWTGLSKGKNYEWHAELTNGSHLLKTGTWTFTTMPQKATVEYRINSSDDDAEEINGSVILSSATLDFMNDTSLGLQDYVGMRWNGIQIPKGALIKNAYMEFAPADSNSEIVNLRLYGEADDKPLEFSNDTNNISSRPRTVAFVEWMNISDWTGKVQTPDMSAIIQEIIDRSGWQSGNSLVVIVANIDNTAGYRIATSYDGNSSLAPLLHIEYSLVEEEADTSEDQEENPAAQIPSSSTATAPLLEFIPPVAIDTIENTYISEISAGGHSRGVFGKSNKLAIEEVRIGVVDTVKDVRITVSLANEPRLKAVNSSDEIIYKYIDITTNVDASAISNATIKFKISQSWFDENGVDPDSVVLKRFSNGVWETLPTIKIGENANFTHYQSESPGFSLFAVAGSKLKIENEAAQTEELDETVVSNEISPVEENTGSGITGFFARGVFTPWSVAAFVGASTLIVLMAIKTRLSPRTMQSKKN